MFALKSCVFAVVFAISASALTTPHFSMPRRAHNDIAARVAAPAPAPVPVQPEFGKRERMVSRKRSAKRDNAKRCQPRPTSSTAAASSTASASAASPTTDIPENVAPTPVLPSSAQASLPASSSSQDDTPAASPTPDPIAAAPASSPPDSDTSNEPSYMTGTQTGQGTFYATGLGSCGITNSDTDYIAAVSHLLYDTYPGYTGGNPNNNPICGRKIQATYQGKSVTIAVTDRCAACQITDLDFSPSAFDQLADPAIGRISGMTWVWV